MRAGAFPQPLIAVLAIVQVLITPLVSPRPCVTSMSPGMI